MIVKKMCLFIAKNNTKWDLSYTLCFHVRLYANFWYRWCICDERAFWNRKFKGGV